MIFIFDLLVTNGCLCQIQFMLLITPLNPFALTDKFADHLSSTRRFVKGNNKLFFIHTFACIYFNIYFFFSSTDFICFLLCIFIIYFHFFIYFFVFFILLLVI